MSTRHPVVLFVSLAAAALLPGADAFPQVPEPVSPGAADRIAEVDGRCPAFSWAPVTGSAGHEVVGYRLPDDVSDVWSADLSDAEISIHVQVPGAASAWQPELADCLQPDERYVWFVRAVFRMNAGEVVEAGEWSEARFFAVSGVPTPREVEEALRVLRRYADAGEAARFRLEATPGEPDRSATARVGSSTPGGVRRTVAKSLTSATTAIRGSLSETTGETYGVVGISNSPGGAGLGAANTNGGPDVLLDGSADGQADTIISQAGIDRPSPTSQWFSLINSDAGMLSLDVEGKIVGSALAVSGAADLSGATITLTGASITGGTYSSGTFSGVHTGDGSGLTDIGAGSITTGRLAGARLPEHTPWDCRWYVGASDSENVSVVCADDRHLVSGFCYTSDTSCGVGWYRPLGLHELTSGIHLPDLGTGMYCVFTGTCDDAGSPNKAIALCCSTD